jgi:hypothetical protein
MVWKKTSQNTANQKPLKSPEPQGPKDGAPAGFGFREGMQPACFFGYFLCAKESNNTT